MRYIIIGAGAVGGTVGGRLAEAGHEVVLVARGAHYEALREGGLRLVTPQGTSTHRLPTVEGPEALGELRADDVLMLAVKTQDSEAALEAWSPRPVAGGGTAAERLPLVCAQNGVESQRLALRRFRRVYGACVWLPATFVEPGVVSAPSSPLSGILRLGRYPHGTDESARRIAAHLESTARFEAPVVPDVTRWQYAKLLGNLGNAIGAVSGVLSGEEGLAFLGRVRAEGEAVLDAAGIAYAGQEEERLARGDKVHFDPHNSARGAGSSWQSLSRGTGTIEADYLNGEIALLGRLHGVPTPLNDLLQRLANTFARERREAGSMPMAELVGLADAAVTP
ncbi:ketopantoate reductase family protein [Streptomyces sp. NPDC058470]|uniref:ketopantoate reductase family protein n=1 Tax=Streptomyces sp. NPDC058470 TaxID=3346515 RepID=UPI003661AD8D